MAQRSVLGHLTDGPDAAFVRNGHAILCGVGGVGVGRGAAVDHEGEDKIGQCAQQDDDAHGEQELGAAGLCGVALVEVFGHGTFSFKQYTFTV